jgi:dihydroorotate dehydrogenase
MSPTPSAPPVAAASSAVRSPAGTFAAGIEPAVIDSLAQDIKARVQSEDELVRRYERRVSDPERRRAAHQVIAGIYRQVGGHSGAEWLSALVELAYYTDFQYLLKKNRLTYPAYNILEEYFVNASQPSGPVTPRLPRVRGREWPLFGRSIGLPIGVPASVLTANAEWVRYFARNGFNVLTYKTVRSTPREPYPSPNWIFLPSITRPLAIEKAAPTIEADPHDWVRPGSPEVSTANSFGVPSPSPEVWEADLEEAFTVLREGQCLIVSVMGDDYAGSGKSAVLAADFAAVADRARRVGADIIELNLSCPNSLDRRSAIKPPLCLDIELTYQVVAETRARVGGGVNLIAKLSYLPEAHLAELLRRIGPLIDGVSGINTLQSPVRTRSNEELFPGRKQAGIAGVAIRNHALYFIRAVAKLRAELNLQLEILGMGGVTDPSSFEALFMAGANVVQTASGALVNPLLAWECGDKVGLTLPTMPPLTTDVQVHIEAEIVAAVPLDSYIDRFHFARTLSIPASQTFEVLENLARDGRLVERVDGRSRLYRRAG